MTLAAEHPRAAEWAPSLAAHRADHVFVRARFGLDPEPDFADRVLALHRPATWAIGSIGVHDAMVLRDMVCGLRPSRVLEIGTAAGTSALLLARAMGEAGCAAGEHPAVHTFDLHPWCYFDRSRAVGSAIDEAEPNVRSRIARRVGVTALDAGREFAGADIRMAFVDADHRHPGPAADVLALLPAMTPGGWIVLHDINLPAEADHYERVKGVRVDWKQHGAKWLFETWPFEKLVPPMHKNIGALRVPVDCAVTAADLAPCLRDPSMPWEMTPAPDILRLFDH
ncbi:MAG: class I SAM-dependent methyltransferase [Planctomycetota bacterium]|nr:class I SAM-dependent methyltransferase [Planctomycetota bacterium]